MVIKVTELYYIYVYNKDRSEGRGKQGRKEVMCGLK